MMAIFDTAARRLFSEHYPETPHIVAHNLRDHRLLTIESLAVLGDALPPQSVEYNKADGGPVIGRFSSSLNRKKELVSVASNLPSSGKDTAISDEEELLAIGALKEIDAAAGEVKSMRTAQAHLRRGAAAFLLDFLITKARQRGYQRLCLETGSGPAFEPALALYRRYGFENCDPFGDYEASAFNQFLQLRL